LRNVGHDISPYSPLSRLFRNVIYIDADAVPEMQFCIEARREMQSTPFQTALADCRGADRVQYESVLALKRDILRLLHGEFARGSGSAAEERRAAYEKFVTEQGDALDKFATFAALESHLAESGHAQDWRDWPRQYQDHQSAAVAGFRRNRAEDVEFQKYLQFELDRQMARAARAARGAGMSIGLYQDLAIGTSAGGADTWAYPQLFIHGARVGAPPDDYSHTGQDWGLPPIHPVALREDRYCYWRRLLQANMAHSGALRIDHVMGLLRQYWIPPGASAFEGAYVAYPADDLFGILALESLRHDAVIIGEDLGTVPAGFADVLSQRGILSCQVLYFEREGAGEFKPARAYSDRALVTSTTHDHPSLACFWRGDDLTLRRRVGSIDSDERLEAAKRQRDRDKRALLRVLKIDERLADRDLPYAALCAAVHRFLAGTPAPLLGLMLDDLTGELEPVNLPGVGPERHDSWRRRMRMLLEELMQSAVVSEGMQGASERRPPQHPVL
jgi:4-alpha-glucanotransferase